MFKSIAFGLLIVLPLSGCNTTPQKSAQLPKKFEIDWPDKGVKARFMYITRQVRGLQDSSKCAGEVAVYNYGKNDFKNISLEVSFFSSSDELIAKDEFTFYSGLISGGKIHYKPDVSNPLQTPDGSEYFAECPDSMEKLSAKLWAS